MVSLHGYCDIIAANSVNSDLEREFAKYHITIHKLPESAFGEEVPEGLKVITFSFSSVKVRGIAKRRHFRYSETISEHARGFYQ